MTVAGVLQQPFGAALVPGQQDTWPLTTARVSASAAIEFPELWAAVQYQQAMLRLEDGDVDDAQKSLRELLKVHPNWSQRILAVYYLRLISGEEIPLEPPSDEIPITPDLLAPEEVATPAPAS
jgi:hypothetical protein